MEGNAAPVVSKIQEPPGRKLGNAGATSIAADRAGGREPLAKGVVGLLDHAMDACDRGDLAEAEAQARRCVTIHPKHEMPWYVLGVVLLQSGRYQQLVDELTDGVQPRPDWPFASFLVGYAHCVLGNHEAAAGWLHRAWPCPLLHDLLGDDPILEPYRRRVQALATPWGQDDFN